MSGVVKYQMVAGSEWVDSVTGAWDDVTNPYDQRTWAQVPAGSADDVDRAVEAAQNSFQSGPWSEATPAQRAAMLRRLGDLIVANAEELARIQVMENGKVLREQLDQTRALSANCYYFAGLAENITGLTVPSNSPTSFTYTVREPVGVVAAILPWNSPLGLFMWKFAPAVAAGCTFVVKPSEVTPVSILVMAKLISEAGFPDGVVNVVTGGGEVGAALAAHPGVNRIAFTGSTAVGRKIAKAAAENIVQVSLELGGKSPNIVFADADLDGAVAGVLAGIFAAAGQTCLAGARVLIEDSVYDEFTARLLARSRTIKLGDPMDPETEVGTIACRPQYDKVMSLIEIGKAEGAELLLGGGRPDNPDLRDGLFIEPTIFGNVTNSMQIARDEVFGPVVCLIRFTTEDEAIEIANDTKYGLASGLWTASLHRTQRVVGKLRAGTVWVNTYRRTSYSMPFGGYKWSGIGRENGPEAVYEYTETKAVYIETGPPIKDPFNPRKK